MRVEYKRIDSEGLDEYLTRMSDSVTALENLSEGHKIWFTHKNPYGCWICDSLLLLRTIIQEVAQEEENFLNTLSAQAPSIDKDAETKTHKS